MDVSGTWAGISDHAGELEVYVKDLGIFLGVLGVKKRHIIIGAKE